MRSIQLIQLDDAIENGFARDPEFMGALVDDNWPKVAELVHGVIGRTLIPDPVSINELRWGGYFVIDEASREVVGSCAFKSAPTDDGVVEIAYFTYPGFEGRGYATQMARTLIELARGATAVRRIIAHTLPESNASTKILQKVGMKFVEETTDPHDGRVWRWEVRTQM